MSAPGRKLRRKKMKSLIRLTSLCGAVVLFPVGNTTAQTPGQCAIAPTCGELGYEQNAADCTGQHMLKCPFDTSKVFCGGDACAADFALSSCDTDIGTCEECGGKYKYTSCNSGWTLNGANCEVNDCSGYSSTSSHISGCSTTASCKKGTSTFYKCTSCSGNFTLSNGNCVCNKYCGGNYSLDSSSCSCVCNISCGYGEHKTSYCSCESCDDYMLSRGYVKEVITRAECEEKYGASCRWYGTSSCGGVTYYMCDNGCVEETER